MANGIAEGSSGGCGVGLCWGTHQIVITWIIRKKKVMEDTRVWAGVAGGRHTGLLGLQAPRCRWCWQHRPRTVSRLPSSPGDQGWHGDPRLSRKGTQNRKRSRQKPDKHLLKLLTGRTHTGEKVYRRRQTGGSVSLKEGRPAA